MEAFRRHGGVAYAVARAITQDPDQGQDAVVAAFVRLPAEANGRAVRSLRMEVLDAVRRCAHDLAAEAPALCGVDARDGRAAVFRSVEPRVRETLSLAIAGRCECAEIAEILQVDQDTVHRDLVVGLDRARAILGR